MVSATDSQEANTDPTGPEAVDSAPVSPVRGSVLHEAQDLYRDGLAAALGGQRAEAEHLLRASLALDPQNHQAWFWLAGMVRSPEESIQCLERVLELVPDDPHALEGLEWARRRLAGEAETAGAPSEAVSDDEGIDGRERTEMHASRPLASSVQAQTSRLMWIAVVVALILLACAIAIAAWLALGRSRTPLPTPPGSATLPAPVVVTMVPGGQSASRPISFRTAVVPTEMPATPHRITPAGTRSAAAEAPFNGPTGGAAQPAASSTPSPTTVADATMPPAARATAGGFRPAWYTDGAPLSFLWPSGWRTYAGLLSREASHDAQRGTQRTGKWIDVDISEQTLRAYEDGVEFMEVKVSTGPKTKPTVQGTFHVLSKFRSIDMYGADYYVPAVPYAMFFHDGYAIHGATWHNNFGRPTGHGCVNLRPADAKKLFDWADPKVPAGAWFAMTSRPDRGTTVVVHE